MTQVYKLNAQDKKSIENKLDKYGVVCNDNASLLKAVEEWYSGRMRSRKPFTINQK